MNEKIIENLKYFINNTFIVGGYGYQYKQALMSLLNGANLEEVLNWYNTELKGD